MTIFFIGSCAIGSYIKKLRTSPNFCKFLPWEIFVIWIWHFHNTIIFVSRQHDVGISLSFFIKSNSLPLDFITDLLKYVEIFQKWRIYENDLPMYWGIRFYRTSLVLSMHTAKLFLLLLLLLLIVFPILQICMKYHKTINLFIKANIKWQIKRMRYLNVWSSHIFL